MTRREHDHDPRLDAASPALELSSAEVEPVVGAPPRRQNTALWVAALGLGAVLLFAGLNAKRLDRPADSLVSATPGASLASVDPPPLDLAPIVAQPQQIAFTNPPLGGLSLSPTPVAIALAPQPPVFSAAAPNQGDMLARRRAPAVIVDFGSPAAGRAEPITLAQASAAPAGASEGPSASPAGARMNPDEQFSARVAEGDQPERARATRMGALDTLVSQGTVIPAVLETAINSDLPGFTRAVVSRDVRSFDGKSVLVPRGSRLIGQYKSAVALGQSRAFVIWTRVIRPDGVSIQIGSPGTDALGRGGLEGEVDRHFFQRFGGSILLSVLNAGVASIAKTPSTQISIGSPGAAAGAAASALQGEAVSPTIKVDQGEAIRIFVTRDLDFSGVGANK